ncbi:GNAT family N-acetyltransferase [Pendulispora rubella]|uniref:GNAT family N-acetyltransferase n=1 Tax=Pendulispora rubella TaxID=2741070 RepID=A0ABZ2KZ64_9BACT
MGTHDPRIERLPEEEVVHRATSGALPSRWKMLVSEAGILTLGAEELVIERGEPRVGQAVCLLSGNRIAFRRVLELNGSSTSGMRLRADVAPFEDRWTDGILGVVQPRSIDRAVAVNPVQFTRASWYAAVASAHLRSVKRRLQKQQRLPLTTRLLSADEWPGVRSFWQEACGRGLPVQAHANQHVVGLFDGARLVGVNIHLGFGSQAYSAFTLVDRRYRGCGGGRKMIEHAVAISYERKFESIYVNINVRNLPSIAAYRACGFHPMRWWSDEADPLASAERQQMVFELDLTKRRP